jgi:hypothetical protein
MHLDQTMPQRFELGAVRHIDWDTEIVRTDGGHEVRNNRWLLPVRTWEFSLPHMRRDDADYIALMALWIAAEGSLHSFWLNDPEDDTDASVYPVRFDTPLQLSFPASHLVHIDTFTLVEVKDVEDS